MFEVSMLRSFVAVVSFSLFATAVGCGGTPEPEPEPEPCVPTAGVDEPDELGTDSDCDGVDGTASSAVFVTSTGVDVNTLSAGTRDQPVRTIGFAQSLAMTRAATQVLVGEGTYAGQLVVVEGIDVHGGYQPNADWRRAATAVTLIVSNGPALLAESIEAPTRLTRLTIQAADAVEPSQSSIGARVVESDGLTLEDVVIRAGAGAPGLAGAAASTPATTGGPGDPGQVGRYVTDVVGTSACAPLGYFCANLAVFGSFTSTYSAAWSGSHQGGNGGSSPCGCGVGGNGGVGWVIPPGNAEGVLQTGFGGPGSTGQQFVSSCAAGVPGAGGVPAGQPTTNTGGQFTINSPVAAGIASNGGAGNPGGDGSGASIGSFDESGYTPSNGGVGTTGGPGTGGAGGGGGRSAICIAPSLITYVASGGSGGGGGAGGCGGQPGEAGTGGGASVGLYLWNTSPTLIRVTVQTSNGGAGGIGAPGQTGGSGGTGGPGGTPGAHPNAGSFAGWTCTAASSGAAGGGGGQGGRGGGGGGGAGGASVGVILGGTSTLEPASSSLVIVPGQGGQPGAGGGINNAGAAGASEMQIVVP